MAPTLSHRGPQGSQAGGDGQAVLGAPVPFLCPSLYTACLAELRARPFGSH